MRHQLTVGKLIEQLSEYDRDTLVVVGAEDHSYRIAYVSDALAERDGQYIGEAQYGDDNAFTVVVVS